MLKLWRSEIPQGSARPPYRLGVLVDDGTSAPPDADLTAAWLKNHRKHLRLDRVV